MRAVSIKQPWASLICTPRQNNPKSGIKDIENRTWRTHFRGRVFVHASAKDLGSFFTNLNQDQLKEVESQLQKVRAGNKDFYPNRPISAIIGEVDIIDCVINHPSIWAEKTEYFGKVCDENKCPEFIKWTFDMGANCESCKLVGQSYTVDTLPKKCLHKEKMPKPIYNWVLANPVLYDQPILNVKGALSFWEPEECLQECIACGQYLRIEDTVEDDGCNYYHAKCHTEMLPSLLKDAQENPIH